jgi:CRP/FNR family transcriptional regulator
VEQTKKSLFKKDAYIYVEGDEDSETVYIMEKGTAELTSANKLVKRYKPVVSDGEVFGFISALCNRPRMESAIARRDSVVVAVPKNRFIFLMQKSPEIAIKLLRYFAEELRLYDEMMFSVSDRESSLLPEDMEMFNQGEYYHRAGEKAFAHYVLSRYLQIHPDGMRSDEAQSIIAGIESGGFKGTPAPRKDGIYKVYADRQMIFCENEPGEELYIIREGKVKIVKVNNNNEILLSVLREGEVFGELAIVSDKNRNASAVSWGRTVLLPIRKENLTWVLTKSPAIINKIFMAISQRIWFTFIMLEAKLYTKPITRLYSFLENKLLEGDISLHSKKPVSLNYSIEELLRMCEAPPSRRNSLMDSLTDDTNIEFNFRQVVIKNPSILASRAKTYKSRDHIKSADDEADSIEAIRTGAEEKPLPADESITGDEFVAATGTDEPEDFMNSAPPAEEGGERLSLPSDEISFD